MKKKISKKVKSKRGVLKPYKEILSKIEELKKDRQTLPEYNFFGDNNWEGLDKQIEVLEKLIKEEWDELDIRAEIGSLEDDKIDEELDDEYETPYDDAIEILEWAINEREF